MGQSLVLHCAGARAAYEMVVTAYAEGDRRTLKNLLSRDVYEGCEAAITEREKAGHKAETRFVSIDSADITHAELKNRSAQVTARIWNASREMFNRLPDGYARIRARVLDPECTDLSNVPEVVLQCCSYGGGRKFRAGDACGFEDAPVARVEPDHRRVVAHRVDAPPRRQVQLGAGRDHPTHVGVADVAHRADEQVGRERRREVNDDTRRHIAPSHLP